MRQLTRVVSSALAATLAIVVVGAVPASADTATVGVGTTNTKTSVLDLQLGSLLELALLTDVGGVNIDPHFGALQAGTSLVPITLKSAALHLDLSTPAIKTLSPGGQTDALGQSLTLKSLGVPELLATATIKPAALHSDFTAGVAHSTLKAAEIDNLTLLGGALASIDLLSSNLGANALTAQADGARGVQIGQIKLLDLGALLKGLGIDLLQLPIGVVSNLLSTLNLPLPAVAGLAGGTGGATTLVGLVTNLSNLVTSLRATVVGTVTQLTAPVDALTQSLLGALHLPIPTVGTLVTDVDALVGTLQKSLVDLLTSVLKTLDSFPLVKVAGTKLGIATKAADTVANSTAGITVDPLHITVANVPLPAIDLSSVVNGVNAILNQANSLLNGVLGVLGLPVNLLSLSLLDQAKNVTQTGDYTNAAAGITMLTAKLAPIDSGLIGGILSKLGGGAPVGSVLGGPVAGGLPASDSVSGLGGLLGVLSPLLGGVKLSVASLAGASTYTFAPAPPAVIPPTPANIVTPPPAAVIPPRLPHTGGDPQTAILGVILAALGLAAIRWRRLTRAKVSSPA